MKKYLVNTPIADLRREPIPCEKFYDSLQETQILYNERLLGFPANNGWVYVQATEQLKFFSDGEWGGYPGWVHASHLIEVDDFPKPNLCVTTPAGTIEKRLGVIQVSMGTCLEGIKSSKTGGSSDCPMAMKELFRKMK